MRGSVTKEEWQGGRGSWTKKQEPCDKDSKVVIPCSGIRNHDVCTRHARVGWRIIPTSFLAAVASGRRTTADDDDDDEDDGGGGRQRGGGGG